MITVHINPPGTEDEYLKCLNASYNPWGNRQQYDWYFRRKTAYPDLDLIVLRIDGRMAAGSGVSYRKLALPNENEITVGLVTGAWTLPRFRDQGCFARVIRESVKVTKEKGGALLLGFVKQSNASSRQMARLGSALFPSLYLKSALQETVIGVAAEFRQVESSEQLIATLFARLKGKSFGYAHFVYADERDFSSQFIDRPAPTEIVSDGDGNFGIIEKREEVDVLQLVVSDSEDVVEMAKVMAGFANYANGKGRQLVSCATTPTIIDAAVNAGFDANAGYLTALIADESSLNNQLPSPVPLAPTDSHLLGDPNSACFLGPWNVHSGDRL